MNRFSPALSAAILAAASSSLPAQSTFAPSPGWSLEGAPAVAAPAAIDSKQPADPAAFEEVKMDFRIADGPFKPTWESIKENYPGAPDWFRQAKFGVFIHWGPQAAGRSGDWYARNLYRQGHPAYNNHLKAYGHPSEVGYKEVLRDWTAPKWDAATLTKQFHDAGIRFVMAVGVHHDNYDLWDSTYNPWNSVKIGPKKDMMGIWAKEARKLGMKFAITFHHEYSWWWWGDAYKGDKTGPKAGIPYDGNLTLADGKGKWWEGLDPRLLYNINLNEYYQATEIPFGRKGIFQDHQEYAKWYAERWALRILDAIDKYDPDMFYTDGNGPEPFCGVNSGAGFKSDAGRRVVAHFYNRSLAKHGKVDTLALIKFQADNPSVGMTFENNVPGDIKLSQPWIGENPIGDWYYGPNYHYAAINLIRSLLEYASRDGNYACAIPVDPEGGMDPECVAMLKDMGRWMKVNGDAIYGSKAWKKWGEGQKNGNRILVHEGKLSKETASLPFNTTDFRFTVDKAGRLTAWCMALPKGGEKLRILSLGSDAKLFDGKIRSVRLIGGGKVDFVQKGDALEITCPASMPFEHAVGFTIE